MTRRPLTQERAVKGTTGSGCRPGDALCEASATRGGECFGGGGSRLQAVKETHLCSASKQSGKQNKTKRVSVINQETANLKEGLEFHKGSI